MIFFFFVLRRAISVLRSAVCGSRFAIIVSSDARLTICDFCSACRVWGFVFCVLSATFTLMSEAGLDIPCLFPFTDIFLQDHQFVRQETINTKSLGQETITDHNS